MTCDNIVCGTGIEPVASSESGRHSDDPVGGTVEAVRPSVFKREWFKLQVGSPAAECRQIHLGPPDVILYRVIPVTSE